MKTMKKELLAILKIFLLIFVICSLLSYHHTDFEILSLGKEKTANLFGLLGACFSGALIGMFGIGAYWLPLLMLFLHRRYMQEYPKKEIIRSGTGGLILMIISGSFSALWGDSIRIRGTEIASGGLAGSFSKFLLVSALGQTGSVLLLVLAFPAAYMCITGDSLAVIGKKIRGRFMEKGRRAKENLELWKVQGQTLPRIPVLAQLPVKKLIPLLPKSLLPRETGREVSPEPFRPEVMPDIPAVAKREVPAPEPELRKGIPPSEGMPGIPAAAKREMPAPEPEAPKGISPSEAPFRGRNVFTSLFPGGQKGFQLPPVGFLTDPVRSAASADENYLNRQGRMLHSKLEDFGVKGEVVRVIPGPVITTFEYRPASGVKINKILNLSDDLALALRAMTIRIVAPIPGRSVIGIEVPNKQRETVRLKEIITSPEFKKNASKLTLCLGKDIVGHPVTARLEQMPHLLIAGATGTGKSVGLNSMICSLLYKAGPDDVKMVLIDPKRIELSMYDGIPHLITPVVTDVRKATNALFWAVNEMERRYQLLSEKRVRNIRQYNRKVEKEIRGNSAPESDKLPYIVLIIDELSDLMMVASKDVEFSLLRLAQMARASGIHLILATQRPSVDVLTGVIKANFPTRLSFRVSSKTDSRTIIDSNGAQSLLGDGDMLFLPPGTANLQRIHGAYISEDEVLRVTDFLKEQQIPEYDRSILEGGAGTLPEEEMENEEGEVIVYDERYDDAVALVTQTKQVTVSLIQRQLRVGYKRASRIIEIMEKEGIVSPPGTGKGRSREVLVRGYEDMP
jgi:S-DNA-T family DNA segregation ATPase FtsK/SpoIIIE